MLNSKCVACKISSEDRNMMFSSIGGDGFVKRNELSWVKFA